MAKSKKKILISAATSIVLVLAIVLGLVFGLGAKNRISDHNPVNSLNQYDVQSYKTNTAVGFEGIVTGTVEPVKPIEEVKNDGGIFNNTVYPSFGSTLSSVIGNTPEKNAARGALIREASYLTATGTKNAGGGGYKWMDKDGLLYAGTTAAPSPTLYTSGELTGTQRQLYKHTAANNLYGGNVSDDEPRISKIVKMRPRGYSGYGVTGLYAPAGEVIKIVLSEADMNATGGIDIHIGQALYNGKANNIWTGKNQMQRFPVLLNTMVVDKNTSVYDEETKTYTAYVGSFIGGPIYIRNENVIFSATISGGVAYSHFILGYTTQQEFEENAKSTAPYFDLEVWNYGVLHSGPKRQAAGFSYDDLYKVAVLWDKVASVTTTGSNQGIVFLYEPFVAAGAAVAFPGQGSVNCPEGWMKSSLNYNQIISSGAWGNFHEYHHNFQGYGVGGGGEVTNNGMTLVSYALFTKISEKRGIGSFGAQGLGGWNNYTSATWALEDVLKIARPNENPSNGNKGLALYATLLHNFGPNNYIQAKYQQRSRGYGESYTGYLKAWQDITHNNMSYYFNNILGGGVAANVSNSEYPMFVPVSSVYQTGRSYMYDGEKEYITTMRPYVIPYGQSFTVDLREYTAPSGQYKSGSIVIPSDFTYRIKNITQPENGKLEETDVEGVYKFVPTKALDSGKIYVTLEITHKNNTFEVDDVDLVLEFKQSQETNKWEITRTTYTYDETLYTDAEAAYNANFAGFVNKEVKPQSNPTQNCNTDIWYYPDTEENRQKYPNVPEHYFVHDKTIEVLQGKLYAEEEGRYRIYLRGRSNCALYYSLDGGNTYQIGATIKDTGTVSNSHLFRPNNENTYFDLDLPEKSWVYIREVLIVQTSPSVSYIGVGMKAWTTPMFTMRDKYYDKNGNEVASPEAENYDHTKTHYYDYRGNEVTEEEANKAEPIPPTFNNNVNSQPYVNAYRDSYEFIVDDFETDYFYTRKYTYSYTDNVLQNTDQELLKDQCRYSPGSASWGGSGKGVALENAIDGNKNTWIHTNNNAISASNPLVITVDMKEAKAVNRMSLFSSNRPNGDWKVAKSFKLEGSLDGETYFTVYEIENRAFTGRNFSVDFEEQTFRYYRLTVTASYSTHIIICDIEMWRTFELIGGNHLNPDNEIFNYTKGWHGANVYSTFGHVYVGNKNASMSFEFEGTRLGILTSIAYEQNFEVYIDGNKVDSVQVKEDTNATKMIYISQKLSSGRHNVTIKCTGEANIDSIILYNEG